MRGNRLKLLREERKMKQEELAKILSMSTSAIGMYERNEREPNNELTIKLADFFNVSTDYLLGKSDIRNSKNSDSDKLVITLSTKDYPNITIEQKKQIEAFAKFILKDNKKSDTKK